MLSIILKQTGSIHRPVSSQNNILFRPSIACLSGVHTRSKNVGKYFFTQNAHNGNGITNIEPKNNELKEKLIKDWLIEIGFKKQADRYQQLFETQEYHTLKDLTLLPPNEQQLEKYGILAGKHRNQILSELKKLSLSQDFLGIKTRFDSIFGSYPLTTLYTNKERPKSPLEIPVKAQIIDGKERLENKLLDLNVADAVEKVKQVLSVSNTSRDKALLGTLRGIGSGKTRMLEELRCALLQIDDVLPIAITYNRAWTPRLAEKSYFGNKPEVIYALGIVARMASVIYEIDFGNIIPQLSSFSQCLDGVKIIVSFIQHVVERIQAFHPIKNFVLLMDESSRVLETFPSMAFDIHSVIRTALLVDDSLKINTALVMTSLEYEVFGYTTTDRPILPIILPHELSPNKIVSDWWLAKVPGVVAPNKIEILKVVAASMCSLPRIVESVAKFIPDNIHENPDPSFVKKILDCAKLQIDTRYQGLPHLEPDLMLALIFNDELPNLLNGKNLSPMGMRVMSMVKNSVFTNSVSINVLKEFVPETSFIMLQKAIQKNPKSKTTEMINSLFDDIFFKPRSLSQEGDILERMVFSWFKVRCYILMENNVTSVNLSRLLGNVKVEPNPSVFLPTHSEKIPDVSNVLANVYKNSRGFLEEMGKLKLSETVPVYMEMGSKEQAFDIFVALQNTVTKKPLLLFIENSSQQEFLQSPLNSSHPDNTHFRRKYDKIMKIYDGAQQTCASSIVGADDLASAFLRGDFLFVYVTTHKDLPQLTSNQKALVVGRDTVKNFFGPLWPVYAALRHNWKKEA